MKNKLLLIRAFMRQARENPAVLQTLQFQVMITLVDELIALSALPSLANDSDKWLDGTKILRNEDLV